MYQQSRRAMGVLKKIDEYLQLLQCEPFAIVLRRNDMEEKVQQLTRSNRVPHLEKHVSSILRD